MRLENVKRDLERLPERGEFIFMQSDKSFNGFSFIPFVAEKETIKHMYASTYSVSTKVIDAFVELHEQGMIDSMTLLVSDSMIKRVPVAVNNLQAAAAAHGNIQVKFAWNHSKVALLETASNHYVIEGSGNWSENAQYEQYLFANDVGLFRFRESLFTDTEIRHEF
jgi:nucleoside diphosphate kinase